MCSDALEGENNSDVMCVLIETSFNRKRLLQNGHVEFEKWGPSGMEDLMKNIIKLHYG